MLNIFCYREQGEIRFATFEICNKLSIKEKQKKNGQKYDTKIWETLY